MRAQVEAGVRRLVGGHRRQMIEVFVPAAAAMASATPRPVDDQLIFIGSPLSEMCGMVFQ
ncbi:MAG: hypothetical protein M3Z25_15420 [Actinomycetota bacterium]|nr:hypothetical protein [Actinomycetota bacterium]